MNMYILFQTIVYTDSLHILSQKALCISTYINSYPLYQLSQMSYTQAYTFFKKLCLTEPHTNVHIYVWSRKMKHINKTCLSLSKK